MLVSAGADVTIRDQEGTTPLGVLFSQDDPFTGAKEVILGFLTPSLAGQLRVQSAMIKQRPAFIYLCDQGRADVDLVQRLLELGANVNQAERDGSTALHGAAWFYNHRLCELLLARGANVNAQDELGRSPLHELTRSTYGRSAFFETDREADILKTADVLVAKGADRRLKDKEGKTAWDLFKAPPLTDDEGRDLFRQLRKKVR
jgi:ankyrin repeat protein